MARGRECDSGESLRVARGAAARVTSLWTRCSRNRWSFTPLACGRRSKHASLSGRRRAAAKRISRRAIPDDRGYRQSNTISAQCARQAAGDAGGALAAPARPQPLSIEQLSPQPERSGGDHRAHRDRLPPPARSPPGSKTIRRWPSSAALASGSEARDSLRLSATEHVRRARMLSSLVFDSRGRVVQNPLDGRPMPTTTDKLPAGASVWHGATA